MIKRQILQNFRFWRDSPNRKPLILRGARQVGKSFIVREFSKEFENFIEINFDEKDSVKKYFDSDLTINKIITELEGFSGKKIVAGKTLLFLDEIQECPNAIRSLRYFYEQMPELHVISAGSLLEFELEKISIPVGRVAFMNLFPLTFHEFLLALDQEFLINELKEKLLKENLSGSVHEKLLSLLRKYIYIGGMPEVVQAYITHNNILLCQEIQSQIINTYRQDFFKYAKKYQIEHVRMAFNALPFNVGKKIKYSNISSELRSSYVKASLELLIKAGVAHKIYHSSSNGTPLGAEIDPKDYKCTMLDVGLMNKMLGLSFDSITNEERIELINKGDIAEQLIGQELFSQLPEDSIYYWRRESVSSSAEVDYVISIGNKIIPLEVKAGADGKLKSLFQFVKEKDHCQLIIRFYSGVYKTSNIEISDPESRSREVLLASIPLYGVKAWLESFLESF